MSKTSAASQGLLPPSAGHRRRQHVVAAEGPPGSRSTSRSRLRRLGVGLVAVTVAGAPLVACSSSGSSSKSPTAINNSSAPSAQGGSGTPNLSYSGTLTMAAGGYTPPLPGVKVAPGAVASAGMQKAADAFHQMYPNITIKFVPSTAEIGTSQWYITQSAARTLPDVSTVPGYYVNMTLPVGIYEDLLPSFKQPNPFIPGNKQWMDTMNSAALHIDTVPGNTKGSSGIFVVNGDWGGIGFYYNKKLFAEAGITTPPNSWNELVADSQQLTQRLQPKGVYAGASFSPVVYNWFAHYFQANFLGEAKMKQIHDIPPELGAGQQPYFYSHDGAWMNPSKNPKLTSWFSMGKQLTDTWAPKDVKVPMNTSGSVPNGVQMFLGQEVAYALVSGYSIPSQVASLPKSRQFPVGYFEIKDFSGSSPDATDLSVWQDNGGPETAFQYGIATTKSNSTMTQQKFDASRAWLQFITTPKWDAAIVNGSKNALPIIQGAATTPDLQPILAQLNAVSDKYYPIALFDSLTPTSFNKIDGLYLRYIGGYITEDEAKKEFNSDADSIIKEYSAKNQDVINKLADYEKKQGHG